MASSASIDVVLVNAINKATLEVLKTMANTDVQLKEIVAKPEYVASGDISAIIGITGESGEGTVSLSFSNDLANLIVGRLLGQKPETISADERCDGIGELINMISGNAKIAFSQGNTAPYKLSLPMIILGSGHAVAARAKNNPHLLMRFETEGIEFNIQLSFKFE